MNDENNHKQSLNIEIQKRLELQRVENFLRGEVKYLRNEIDELRNSFEYKLGLKINKILFINRLKNIKIFSFLGRKPKNNKEIQPNVKENLSLNQNNTPAVIPVVKDIDFLFVQLSNNKEIGGISQLDSIYQAVKEKNKKTYSVNINFDFSIENNIGENLIIKDEVNRFKVKKVIFSGLESFNFIKNHDNLRFAKKINFLQGPDYLFPGNENKFILFKESLVESEAVIAQSPYLNELANFLNAKNTLTITLGPKQNVFNDKNMPKEKILLISTRKDPDKGLRFSLPIFELLRENGWTIIGFGDLSEPEIAAYFDEHLGRINHQKLAELFQKSALLLDLSLYEGLGLTVIEAGMCGVRSIVSRKGGTESLVHLKNELIFVEDPLNLNELSQKILTLEVNISDTERQKLVENCTKYSWENGIDKIISEIERV